MNVSALRFISEVAGYHKIYILILLLMQVVLGISSVFYAFLLRNVIDAAVGHSKEQMLANMFGFLGLVVLQLVLCAVIRFLDEWARATYENAFKKRLFQEILLRDYEKVMQIHSAEWMNRLTSDTAVVADGLTSIIPSVMGMMAKMIGALVMILAIEPRFGYFMIVGGILLVILTYVFRKRLKRLHKQVQEKDGYVRIFLQEHLNSLIVLKVFGKETDSLQKADIQMEKHKKTRIRKNHFSNVCNIGFGGAMNGVYALGMAYSAFGIYHGTMTYGTLMAILQLIGQIQGPFANITGYLPRYYAMIASAERLMEVESYEKEKIERVKTVEEAKEIYDHKLDSIVFEHVSFGYQKNQERFMVLEDMNLKIRKGEYVAITGTSGCGKSTLLKLLMGLYEPQSGKIRMILKNGEIIPAKQLRRVFSYVPQGNGLMSGTIKDVIAFGKENGDLDWAISLACAEFIYDLPKGLETILGEKGTGLSEGQMQRISIARALYSDAPILILDEATSALDGETESRLLYNLKSLTDKTVLIVTHRPQALDICGKQLEFTEREGLKVKEGR